MKEAEAPAETAADNAIMAGFEAWLSQAADLDQEVFETLRFEARVVRFAAGETLLQAGDVPDDLFFISSGLVRYYYLTPAGQEFNKNFLAGGGVATSLSTFLQDEPMPFFIQALEDTVCVAVPLHVVRTMRHRLHSWERLISRFITDLALSKERREASFLLQSALERYEAFLDDYAGIAHRLPQYHIASYLGITPVALSRIRARRAVS
ncbi:Crp/Fnr family transcriptional regulator [Roseibium denhamense]|uniref:cAMP-binding domain of CRP or a regulatory subunit of cAMP-dependent protein kinases n=2 Tax=Roseibium denhamense TaxID=76305 RepID=A0ABY1NBE7_9HYPH|nr:Crp/Fnr family transcriptional regulator [Roseibium denhamense]SMP05274.1 cAMP-binding domain of CRP or a regulatory subunit of cAMP-dependent protein kinases [Roseibium denhamense]